MCYYFGDAMLGYSCYWLYYYCTERPEVILLDSAFCYFAVSICTLTKFIISNFKSLEIEFKNSVEYTITHDYNFSDLQVVDIFRHTPFLIFSGPIQITPPCQVKSQIFFFSIRLVFVQFLHMSDFNDSTCKNRTVVHEWDDLILLKRG